MNRSECAQLEIGTCLAGDAYQTALAQIVCKGRWLYNVQRLKIQLRNPERDLPPNAAARLRLAQF